MCFFVLKKFRIFCNHSVLIADFSKYRAEEMMIVMWVCKWKPRLYLVDETTVKNPILSSFCCIMKKNWGKKTWVERRIMSTPLFSLVSNTFNIPQWSQSLFLSCFCVFLNIQFHQFFFFKSHCLKISHETARMQKFRNSDKVS